MNFFQKLKQRYSINVFRKRTRRVVFSHDFVDLEKAKTIGFIIHMNQYNSKDLIVLTDYITKLEDHGKQVVLIEINLRRKSEPMFIDTIKSIFINPTHISWTGIPSLSKMQEINYSRPDILINLDTSDNLTSKFICGLSNAKTRAGIAKQGMEMFYELILQLPEDTKLKTLLQQFEHFLKEIEK